MILLTAGSSSQAGSSCESGLALSGDEIPVDVLLFTGTGRRRAEPVSRNRGTGAFGTKAVYRRLGLRLWKQNTKRTCTLLHRNPQSPEQSPPEGNKTLQHSHANLSQMSDVGNNGSPCFRFAYESQICAGNPQSAFHRLQNR